MKRFSKQCFKLMLLEAIHAAANLIDGPRFKDRNVGDESTAAAFAWITEQATPRGLGTGKVLPNVAEYRTSPRL